MSNVILDDGVEIRDRFGVRKFATSGLCEESHVHCHKFDHTTRCTAGIIRITVMEPNDQQVPIKVVELDAGSYDADGNWIGDEFLVVKTSPHAIKSLVPGSAWECCFLHRDDGGKPIESYQGNQEAYL